MKEHPYRINGHTAMKPTLLTLATSIAQTERDYECPQGMIRILSAASGECIVETGNRSIHLVGVRMILLFGHTTYRIKSAKDNFTLTRLDIALEEGDCYGFNFMRLQEDIPEMARLFHPDRSCIVFYDNFEFLMSSIQNIQGFLLYQSEERETQITLTLGFLLTAIATSPWEEDIRTITYSKHVRKAIRYIHENYMCQIMTTDIAREAGVHIGHLHRVFLTETGNSIGEYLTKLRLEKAKSLLMRTDLQTASIAQRVGINSLQYFSRRFKQCVGMTPQTFRRSYALNCAYPNEFTTIQNVKNAVDSCQGE